MTKKLCAVLGWVLIVAGIGGFLMPGMFGFHLSPAHNVVHLLTGALCIFFSKKTERGAKNFCLAFGLVYALLGIVGFMSGPGVSTLHELSGKLDSNMFKMIPGVLEFGTADHVLHLALGLVLIISGAIPVKAEERLAAEARERERVGPS